MLRQQNLEAPLGLFKQPCKSTEMPRLIDHILTEQFETSLYNAMHIDCLKLSQSDIAFISVQLLRALAFLHRNNQSLGVVLTSRRVMLSPASVVKIRRFGNELVTQHAGFSAPHPHSVFTTLYNTVRTFKYDTADGAQLSNETKDLFAFGVLLLEMCTGEKPTSELINKVSCARQLDPAFYAIIRVIFSQAGIVDIPPALEINTDSSAEKWIWDDSISPVTASVLLELLTKRFPFGNSDDVKSLDSESSSVTFPSFLHSDRYFRIREKTNTDKALSDRSYHANVMVKRLEAVEHELVDEQKNFEILVQQFEHLQQEKNAVEHERGLLQTIVNQLNFAAVLNNEQVANLTMQSEDLLMRHCILAEALLKAQALSKKLEADKCRVINENQQFLSELLRLKDDKSRVIELNKNISSECEELRKKIGGERDTLQDLEERLQQSIHLCQVEQCARRKAEIQAETSSKQLLQLEDERCRYSHELWQSPTGLNDVRKSPAIVIALKERELDALTFQLQAAHVHQLQLDSQVAALLDEKQALANDNITVCKAKDKLEQEKLSLEASNAQQEMEKNALRKETETTRAEICTLKQRIIKLEEEREAQEAAAQAAGSRCYRLITQMLS